MIALLKDTQLSGLFSHTYIYRMMSTAIPRSPKIHSREQKFSVLHGSARSTAATAVIPTPLDPKADWLHLVRDGQH
jgi:hypothetical protein